MLALPGKVQRREIDVRPRVHGQLGAAIERVATDAALRRAFGARGRAIVEARFRIETMCAAREALFAELLSTSAGMPEPAAMA